MSETRTDEPKADEAVPDAPAADARRRFAAVTVPALTLAAAVLVGTLVMVASGISPAVAYPALVRGALAPQNLDYLVSVYGFLLAMAVAFAIPFRLGEFNLGGNGHLVAGGAAAAVVALYVPGPGLVVIPLAVLAAALAGGALGAVTVPLSTRLGVPIIISTLLLATPVVALGSYLARFPLADTGSGQAQTERFPDAAHLPGLGAWTYTTVGFLLLVAIAAAFAVVDSRTRPGFEIGLLGQRRGFAVHNGVGAERLTLGAMSAAGAIGGVVGAIIVMSPPFRLVDGALTAPGYTFAGIAAALLAGGRPALLPVTALVFAILEVGGGGMERDAGVPSQLSDVLQALVVIALALRVVAERWLRRRGGGT